MPTNKKVIIIGDLHLKYIKHHENYLENQVSAIQQILDKEGSCRVVFLGDIFHKRSPGPSELLAFDEILNKNPFHKFDVLMGNHDAESRSDNGITALSLFDNLPNVRIFNHIDCDIDNYPSRAWFIPHFENEGRIIYALDSVEKDDLVFGHFGYTGCLNSIGNNDFSIGTDKFKAKTFLGHIHRYKKRGKITIVGTPYSTSFGESEKDCYYIVIEDGKIKKKRINHGIRHIVCQYKELPQKRTLINKKGYFTLLRVLVSEVDDDNSTSIQEKIEKEYKVDFVDIKFKSAINIRKEISNYYPSKEVTKVTDNILKKYVEENTTEFTKEQLWEGFKLLKNENQ